ncbi:hypothetical protein [Nostoc sp. 'Lobaria pulmonaria (5183) cyanobiont']|uniref:hypothetical protein n=1 Tax=Nostoc sp. 'Lobaria pulmonaria (5183) cyanobiont' TaxID=1618022 RepID=UPI001F303C79|nr:hypothetical protein [Nostoc sp. 'Lobaria pulmonaria (5183) cyanobiont']
MNHICCRGARPCAPTAWSIYLKIAVSFVLVRFWRAASYAGRLRHRGLETALTYPIFIGFLGSGFDWRDRLVPSCLFIDPELAHVGLTETEAQQQGYAIHVAKVDASAVPRAKTLGQTDGLLKAIVDTDTGRILGCSLLCHEAGEVISTVQMVMQAQMTYTVLRDGILTYPTMTEGLNILFSKL